MILVGLFPMNEAEKCPEIQWFFINGRANDDSSSCPVTCQSKEQEPRGHVQRTFGSKRRESTRRPVKAGAESYARRTLGSKR